MHALVLSRNYPTHGFPHLGLWVRRQSVALARSCRITVVAPVPYCPPGPLPLEIRKFRDTERMRMDAGMEVHHPRFLAGPGNSTYELDAVSMYCAVRGLFAAVHRATPVDVIHAHFMYPDGATAGMLGRRFGVPVVVTEHSLWTPWMESLKCVRKQALRALRDTVTTVAVSQAVRATMEAVARRPVSARIIPVGVDGQSFPMKADAGGSGEHILYVGWLNDIKGVDILLRAMALVVARRPRARLTLIGGSAYHNAQRKEHSIHDLAAALGLGANVEFRSAQPEAEVARAMRHADVFVLASRRESCGSVLLEALASGTPVVATRSGGPEGIVTEDVGLVVPIGDPPALARAIERIFEDRTRYEPSRLRAHALASFSWDRLADEYLGIYRQAIAGADRCSAAEEQRRLGTG